MTNELYENIEPLTQAVGSLANYTEDSSALITTATLKRAEVFLAKVRDRLLEKANKEFAAKMKSANTTKLILLDGLAIVTTYSPRCTWDYPTDIRRMENELRAAQKTAQLNNTAKKSVPKVNVKEDTTFSISVPEKF